MHRNQIFVSHLRFWLVCKVLQWYTCGDTLIFTPLCELLGLGLVSKPKIMFLNVCKFHLQYWQMCILFANDLCYINTYSYSTVWIIMVYNRFSAKNMPFKCLRISPQIFASLPNFALDLLRDQQFGIPLCE